MGITGLLPFIKDSCSPANITNFKGQTVAIDAYAWLHKGAFSCAHKIVKGEKTDGYVLYCLKLLDMIRRAGVTPIMVFDGCNLKSKELTEIKRRESREKARQKGKELLIEGKVKEAYEYFQRCIDITPEMAFEVIEACKKRKIQCIVAPYEADPQLSYLLKCNMAQVVITEDSDLVVFGCEKILFKMDHLGGGLLYSKSDLAKCFGSKAERMSFEKFRYMCILSGCDYLPSIRGIGLAKAFKFFSLTENLDPYTSLPKVPKYLNMAHGIVTNEYIDSFVKANNTFLYQLVFCPKNQKLVPLNPYPASMNPKKMAYAGKYLEENLAVELAKGNINVKTMKKFTNCTDTELNFSDVEPVPDIPIDNEPKKHLCNAFVFKQNVPSPRTSKKRTFEKSNDSPVNQAADDAKLMSEYCKIESQLFKKPKICAVNTKSFWHTDTKENNCDNENSTTVQVFMPFRKPLSPSTSENGTVLRKILKSRYFQSPKKPRKEDTKINPSWIDIIDSEYNLATDKASIEKSNFSNNDSVENFKKSLILIKSSRSKSPCFDDFDEPKLVIDENDEPKLVIDENDEPKLVIDENDEPKLVIDENDEPDSCSLLADYNEHANLSFDKVFESLDQDSDSCSIIICRDTEETDDSKIEYSESLIDNNCNVIIPETQYSGSNESCSFDLRNSPKFVDSGIGLESAVSSSEIQRQSPMGTQKDFGEKIDENEILETCYFDLDFSPKYEEKTDDDLGSESGLFDLSTQNDDKPNLVESQERETCYFDLTDSPVKEKPKCGRKSMYFFDLNEKCSEATEVLAKYYRKSDSSLELNRRKETRDKLLLSQKNTSKPTCRTPGLSKKQKPRKQNTLFKFKFTKDLLIV